MLNRHPTWWHHRSDLEQEALLAALKAHARFDVARGVKFETFAWYWLRKAVQQYIRLMLGPVTDWASKSSTTIEPGQLAAAEETDPLEIQQAQRVAHDYSARVVRAARQRAWRSDSGGAERDITIFELVELHGVSQADVARRLGISRQRVHAVLRRAHRGAGASERQRSRRAA